MKKILFLLVTVLLSANTLLQAQTVIPYTPQTLTEKQTKKADKKAEKAAKKAEKAARKAAQKAQNETWFNAAAEALKANSFVLEASRIEFKRGRYAYVTPATNFVSLEGKKALVQLSFDGGGMGANGLGGITVEGNASSIEMSTDKKGNINFKMLIQGPAVSATVTILLPKGGNQASATVMPNFNSNRISFSGTLYPASESKIFQGRTF